ncbi:MAG: hypothetical protein ACE5KZ_08465 [Candidatus Scalinduaceae bacterium]
MKYGYYILLLILPLSLILTAFHLKDAKGPYWLNINYDPSYAYLVNSLHLAQFETVWHIHHPGTTLQVLGAIIIKTVNLLYWENDLVEDVFRIPELYLGIMNNFLVGLNVLGLSVLGIFTYFITRNIGLSLLIQLTPFLSTTSLLELTRMRPDHLLLFATLLFVTIIITTFKYSIEKHLKLYTFLFALITGFGTVTKVTFIPLVIIPLLLLPKFRWKLYCLGGTLISFMFFTLPIVNYYPRLFNWFIGTFTHTGHYGYGEKGLIDFPRFYSNIKRIIDSEPVFLIILLMAICIGGILFFSRERDSNQEKTVSRLLFGLVIAQILQIVMAAKHYYPHYLIPSLGLSGITLVLIFKYIHQVKIVRKFTTSWLPSFLIAALVFGFIRISDLQGKYRYLTWIKNESLDIQQKVENNFKEYAIVGWFGASGPIYAFAAFINRVPETKLPKTFQKIYSTSRYYYYNTWDRKYYSLAEWTNGSYKSAPNSLPVKLEEILSKHNHVLFQGHPRFKPNDLSLKEVYVGGGQGIYTLDNYKIMGGK